MELMKIMIVGVIFMTTQASSATPSSPPHLFVQGTRFVHQGGRIELTCNATGGAQIAEDIDWFKDGDKLEVGSHTQFRLTIDEVLSVETGALVSTLRVDPAIARDSGTYVCRSSHIEQIVHIDVSVLAEIPNVKRARQSYNVTVVDPGPTWLILNITSTGMGSAPSKYRIEVTPEDSYDRVGYDVSSREGSDVTMVTLTDLKPYTTYRITVQARYPSGWDRNSVAISGKTASEASEEYYSHGRDVMSSGSSCIHPMVIMCLHLLITCALV